MTPDRAALEALLDEVKEPPKWDKHSAPGGLHVRYQDVLAAIDKARAAIPTPPAPEAAAVERTRDIEKAMDHIAYGRDGDAYYLLANLVQPAPTPPAPTGSASAEALARAVAEDIGTLIQSLLVKPMPDEVRAAIASTRERLDAIIAAARQEGTR